MTCLTTAFSIHGALFKYPAMCVKCSPPHDTEVTPRLTSLHNWGFSWNDMEVRLRRSGSHEIQCCELGVDFGITPSARNGVGVLGTSTLPAFDCFKYEALHGRVSSAALFPPILHCQLLSPGWVLLGSVHSHNSLVSWSAKLGSLRFLLSRLLERLATLPLLSLYPSQGTLL